MLLIDVSYDKEIYLFSVKMVRIKPKYIVKKDEKMGGKLEFGTEVVVNKNGTIASLLGASPGASTAVFAMMQVIEKCFPHQLENEWKEKLLEIIPSYGQKLSENKELAEKVRNYTKEKLELDY